MKTKKKEWPEKLWLKGEDGVLRELPLKIDHPTVDELQKELLAIAKQPEEADEILKLMREAGSEADVFLPGETLEEFLRRHGLDID